MSRQAVCSATSSTFAAPRGLVSSQMLSVTLMKGFLASVGPSHSHSPLAWTPRHVRKRALGGGFLLLEIPNPLYPFITAYLGVADFYQVVFRVSKKTSRRLSDHIMFYKLITRDIGANIPKLLLALNNSDSISPSAIILSSASPSTLPASSPLLGLSANLHQPISGTILPCPENVLKQVWNRCEDISKEPVKFLSHVNRLCEGRQTYVNRKDLSELASFLLLMRRKNWITAESFGRLCNLCLSWTRRLTHQTPTVLLLRSIFRKLPFKGLSVECALRGWMLIAQLDPDRTATWFPQEDQQQQEKWHLSEDFITVFVDEYRYAQEEEGVMLASFVTDSNLGRTDTLRLCNLAYGLAVSSVCGANYLNDEQFLNALGGVDGMAGEPDPYAHIHGPGGRVASSAAGRAILESASAALPLRLLHRSVTVHPMAMPGELKSLNAVTGMLFIKLHRQHPLYTIHQDVQQQQEEQQQEEQQQGMCCGVSGGVGVMIPHYVKVSGGVMSIFTPLYSPSNYHHNNQNKKKNDHHNRNNYTVIARYYLSNHQPHHHDPHHHHHPTQQRQHQTQHQQHHPHQPHKKPSRKGHKSSVNEKLNIQHITINTEQSLPPLPGANNSFMAEYYHTSLWSSLSTALPSIPLPSLSSLSLSSNASSPSPFSPASNITSTSSSSSASSSSSSSSKQHPHSVHSAYAPFTVDINQPPTTMMISHSSISLYPFTITFASSHSQKPPEKKKNEEYDVKIEINGEIVEEDDEEEEEEGEEELVLYATSDESRRSWVSILYAQSTLKHIGIFHPFLPAHVALIP